MPWKDEVRDEQNKRHAANPEPGDYWHEMFCPIRVVLAVHRDAVIFCETKKSVGQDHWTWDLDRVEAITRGKFADRLKYGGISGAANSPMADKFWCDVEPRAHIGFVKEYEARTS